MSGIHRSASGSCQAQHPLEAERQQLAAIVQTLYEGVAAFHPDGTLALVNTAALRLTALTQWAELRAGDGLGPLLPE